MSFCISYPQIFGVFAVHVLSIGTKSPNLSKKPMLARCQIEELRWYTIQRLKFPALFWVFLQY